MYREKINEFRVKLRFDEIDRENRFAFLYGDIVEVDLVGDEPQQIMGVQWLEIHGTEITLDHDEYEIVQDEPTVSVRQDDEYFVARTHPNVSPLADIQ